MNEQHATQASEVRHAHRRRRRWKARGVLVVLVTALVAGSACDDSDTPVDAVTTSSGPAAATTTTTLPAELAAIECTTEAPEAAGSEKPQFDAPPEMVVDPATTYRATMQTSCGAIVFEMDPSDPEQSVNGINNFVFLAREGFYDGLTFHRVVNDFVIQGGDPDGTGTGGPGYLFGGPEDVPEGITYEVGDIAYANSGATETSGSQFFFITGPTGPEALNPQTTFIKFGTIVDGLAVAQRIEKLEVPQSQAPSQPVYIESVTVEEV